MKKWKEKWAAVSRGKKLLVYTTVLLICVMVSYVAIGSPSFCPRMEFRRLEKAYMVGPSTILAEFEQHAFPCNHVIVGETEDSYILCAFGSSYFRFTEYFWYPKTGSMAVYQLPGSSFYTTQFGKSRPMTLILFDLEPQAVRAELELDFLVSEETGKSMHFSATAQRQYDHFFLFDFHGDDDFYSSLHAILTDIAETCREYGRYDQYVTVRLYDAQGQLLREETILAGPTLPEAP